MTSGRARKPIERAPEPTTQEPLRGLQHLGRVALLGRDAIFARAREPVVYAWQDIAVAGTIVLVAGGPGEGKTTLLFLLLAARLTLGKPVGVLGRRIEPAPAEQWVVLVEGEHGEASTCRKLTRSCETLGVHDLALGRVIIIARKAVRIGSDAWNDIVHLVRAGLVSDIALDTLARVAPGDANDEREQVAIYDRIAAVIEVAPAGKSPTVWVTAHTRKGDTDGLAAVSGSTQRTGQADSVLMVKAEKVGGQTVASTVTFWKLREEPDDYPQPVTFAVVKDGDGRRSVRASVAADVDGAPLEARIETLLGTGAKTKSGLASALKRSDADVDAAIGNLFTARRIRSTTVLVRGRSRKAFELRPALPGA